MSTVAIEFCDPGIALVRSREAPVESPAYALLEEGADPLLGAAAYARSRLAPRRVHNRFWDQLSLHELPGGQQGFRTHADLARAHLDALWRRAGRATTTPEEALLVVPGCYERDQLGVLLGVLESCGIGVAGMVDAAVAACVSGSVPSPGSGDALHLDVLLHRSVISELELVDASWKLRKAHSHRQLGLVSAYDMWAKFVAELFVRNTRFDPLHRAESEQALYDLLPVLLERSRSGPRQPLEMQTGEHTHRVTLEREHLSQCAGPVYQRLIGQIEGLRRRGGQLLLLMSARANALPGLAAALGTLHDCRLVTLPAAAAGFGALSREREIRSHDGVIRLLEELRHVGESLPTPAAAPTLPPQLPTHVLLRDRAHPIGSSSLCFVCDGAGDFSGVVEEDQTLPERHLRFFSDGAAVWVESPQLKISCNDRETGRRERVELGDRIRCVGGSEELRLIAIAGPDGA